MKLKKYYFVLIAFVVFLLLFANVYFDKTHSTGYSFFFRSYTQPKKGDYYIFELNKVYEYKGNPTPKRLIKPIVSNLKDYVVIDDNGIKINGLMLRDSVRKKGFNGTFINFNGYNCFVSYIEDLKSYDSRYFGCVDLSKAIKLKPFF